MKSPASAGLFLCRQCGGEALPDRMRPLARLPPGSGAFPCNPAAQAGLQETQAAAAIGLAPARLELFRARNVKPMAVVMAELRSFREGRVFDAAAPDASQRP